MTIEADEIKLPRLKRVKKLIDAEQVAHFFANAVSPDEPNNIEQEQWMQVYALMAAFDADITREAFCDLVVDVLNMRGKSATCATLQQVAFHHTNAHLTPELIARSFQGNRSGVHADASEIARQLSLIAQCRGQEDQVH